MATEPLQYEIQRYERELQGLLAQEGRFVVIHANDPLEVVDTYDDALKLYDEPIRRALKPLTRA